MFLVTVPFVPQLLDFTRSCLSRKLHKNMKTQFFHRLIPTNAILTSKHDLYCYVSVEKGNSSLSRSALSRVDCCYNKKEG